VSEFYLPENHIYFLKVSLGDFNIFKSGHRTLTFFFICLLHKGTSNTLKFTTKPTHIAQISAFYSITPAICKIPPCWRF